MKAEKKLTRLWSILLALVMVIGMLPTTALAEERDAALRFADDAQGEFFYDHSGGYNSEGPTVDTTFTLTQATKITGIWTYHWYADNYDIDFSQQTVTLKNTDTNEVVYSGAICVGHHWNDRNCDWFVFPDIILQPGTYQVIDSHHESWCALNSKGVCMIKGYPLYKFNTPEAITQNGVTATVTFDKTSPQDESTSITATVTLTGTAAAAGTHTVNLTSTKAGLNNTAQTAHVTAGQDLTTPVTNTFSFVMPAKEVDDLVLLHTFESDPSYTISFDANGGSSTMDEVTGISGEYTLPENGFTAPEGKQFKGWATTADGAVVSGTTIDVTADTTLYAIWESIPVTTYTITFDANGGSVTPASAVTDADGKLTSLPTPTRSGRYFFNGWYTAASGGTKVDTSTIFNVDTTIYAQWNCFVDVPSDAYYYDAVLWAVENDITFGVDDTHFAPDDTCTRAQTVTFLWRAAGSPAPKSSVNPFTDVTKGSYYYDAVLWAVENGITVGVDDTHFAPNDACTRAQSVTFLWRSQKSPAADTVNPFTDVVADSYYANAVLWAAENGITSGTSATTFSPNNTCTRAQIVSFLYRFFK